MEKTFEIRTKKGMDDYNTVLFPATKLNNVIFKKDGSNIVYAEEELMSMYNILNHSRVSTTVIYVCQSSNTTIIPIASYDYNYLDSDLEVYYNGLLLVNNMHYVLHNQTNIRLLDFSCNVNDEIVFKILNPNKVKLDLQYENMEDEKGKEVKDIVDSINSYINLVNNGKKLISNEFKNANIDVEWNDTFEKMATELSNVLGKKSKIPSDFGGLFSLPFFETNIAFIHGNLFGIQVDNSLLPKDLGDIFLH